jgi:hypothetical protein
MDNQKAKIFLQSILSEIMQSNGIAATEKYSGLREVDAKVREAKIVLKEIPGLPQTLLNDFEKDDNFTANSRRVRLETLAYYCQSAIKFLDSGAVIEKKKIFRAPDISKLTKVLTNLDSVIQDRWLEAQKCQHSNCYLSAIILMGSILEALLLSRAYLDPITSNKAKSSPKDKSGKVKAIQDWNLNSLIDVAVEVGPNQRLNPTAVLVRRI